jgi:AraC family transcriptional regulator
MSTPELFMNLSAIWNVETPSNLIQTERMTACRWRHALPELPDIVSPTNMLVLTMGHAKAYRVQGGRRLQCVEKRHGLCLHAQGSDGGWTFETSVDVFHFYFSNAMLAQVAEDADIATHELRDLLEVDDPLLTAMAVEAAAAAEDGASGRLYADTLGAAMAFRLLRAHRASGTGSTKPSAICRNGLSPRARRATIAYMNDRLADDVTLNELASVAGLSTYHFCRAFKQTTGLAPYAWLTDRRMERAQELMVAHPKMGLTEIALSVGYQSQAALGAAFKRVTGVTPSQWRRERLL